jgi:hypothetical protein
MAGFLKEKVHFGENYFSILCVNLRYAVVEPVADTGLKKLQR